MRPAPLGLVSTAWQAHLCLPLCSPLYLEHSYVCTRKEGIARTEAERSSEPRNSSEVGCDLGERGLPTACQAPDGWLRPRYALASRNEGMAPFSNCGRALAYGPAGAPWSESNRV